MPAPSLSEAVTIRDILSINIDNKTGSVSYKTGNAKRNEVIREEVQVWSIPGVYSIPSNVNDKKNAPQLLSLTRSDVDLAIGFRDVYTQSIPLGLGVTTGEICMFAPGSDGKSQGTIYLKKDGSINIGTQFNNISGGGNIGISIKPDGSITLGNNLGNNITISNTGITIKNTAGFGITLDESGITLTVGASTFNMSIAGSILTQATTSNIITGINTMIGNPANYQPAIIGLAGIIGLPSPDVLIG